MVKHRPHLALLPLLWLGAHGGGGPGSLGNYPHKVERHKMPKHAKFIWNDHGDGLLELEVNRTLRVASVGRGPTSKLVLRPGAAVVHEKFTLKDRAIYLTENPTLCLGSETKTIEEGARVVLQACEKAADGELPIPHQAFKMALDSRIRAMGSGTCMVVKDNLLMPGTEVVLGDCGEHSGFILNKMFALQGGKIQVKKRTDLHFNVKEGAVGGPIVVWKTEATTDESFEFSGGRFKLKGGDLCLVAVGGIVPGQSLKAVMCSKGAQPLPNEMFEYDDNRHVVCSSTDRNMVFNAKGGAMQPGDEIILWPVDESKLQKAEEL